MRIADIVLVLFLVLTLAIKKDWKRVGLHVIVGTMTGDVLGLLLVAVSYHRHPNAIAWAVNFAYLGAFTGGIYTWCRPASAKCKPRATKSR